MWSIRFAIELAVPISDRCRTRPVTRLTSASARASASSRASEYSLTADFIHGGPEQTSVLWVIQADRNIDRVAGTFAFGIMLGHDVLADRCLVGESNFHFRQRAVGRVPTDFQEI